MANSRKWWSISYILVLCLIANHVYHSQTHGEIKETPTDAHFTYENYVKCQKMVVAVQMADAKHAILMNQCKWFGKFYPYLLKMYYYNLFVHVLICHNASIILWILTVSPEHSW